MRLASFGLFVASLTLLIVALARFAAIPTPALVGTSIGLFMAVGVIRAFPRVGARPRGRHEDGPR